ncbi:MAG UNVERIFIED_CONTAM: hypothetical protein LVR18_45300 [Planctomycetaceae bacterium]
MQCSRLLWLTLLLLLSGLQSVQAQQTGHWDQAFRTDRQSGLQTLLAAASHICQQRLALRLGNYGIQLVSRGW